MKISFIILFLLAAATASSFSLYAQAPVPGLPPTDGTVYAIGRDGNRLYLGGAFRMVGVGTPYGAPVSLSTGAVDRSFPNPDGIVYASVPDGSGGWYIGGSFTKVGSVPRAGLARLNADGSVNPWNPGTSGGAVRALALDGNTLYAGGSFTQAGGQARPRLAAIDASTGTAANWSPAPAAPVRSLFIYNGLLYVGGEFTSIGGQGRGHIASFDLSTGGMTSWNPNVSGIETVPSLPTTVNAMAAHNDTLYIGGFFARCGSQARTDLAAVNITTGATLAWNTLLDDYSFISVQAMMLNQGILYLGGTFTSLGGWARTGLGAVDAVTANTTSWNPNLWPQFNALQGLVYSMQLIDNTIYAGGVFDHAGGSNGTFHSDLLAIDLNGFARPWSCNANAKVYTLSAGSGRLYAGGMFTMLSGQQRNNLAAIDINSNALVDWAPVVSDTVRAMTFSANNVYVGGRFQSPRRFLAAFSKSTGALAAFNPQASMGNLDAASSVLSLAMDGNRLYVGGRFSYQNASAQSRANLVAVDTLTGAATAWDPGLINGSVRALSVAGGNVFAGGDFTHVGNSTREHVVKLPGTDGPVEPFFWWQPTPQGNTVNAIAISGNLVYMGGDFQSGETYANLMQADIETGVRTLWPTGTNAPVTALFVYNGYVVAGGSFTQAAGQPRNRLAVFEAATGALTSWNASVTSDVSSIWNDGSNIYAGGTTNLDANQWPSVMAFGAATPAPLPVRLLSFAARPEAAGSSWRVQCSWATASEQNSRSFIVERSTDGRNYAQVGIVSAAGNSSDLRSYSFTDDAAVQGISYYRLRQVDADGRSTYSSIAIVNINSGVGVVMIYPNPVRNAANILVSVPQKQQARYSIVDAAGVTVSKGSWQLDAGSNKLVLITEKLLPGVYTLVIHAQTEFQRASFTVIGY